MRKHRRLASVVSPMVSLPLPCERAEVLPSILYILTTRILGERK